MGGKNPGGRQSALEQLYLAYRQDVYPLSLLADPAMRRMPRTFSARPSCGR